MRNVSKPNQSLILQVIRGIHQTLPGISLNIKTSIFLLCVMVLSSCSTSKTEMEEVAYNKADIITLTEAQFKQAEISTTTLKASSMSSVLRLNGRIDVPPQNLVSVSVPLGGYLKHTNLLPGMHVKKGDVIARMEDQQYVQLQQDYLQTQSKLHFSELEYRRQYELNQSKASSDKVTQQAEAEWRSNEILLESLKQKLKLINIDPSTLSQSNITSGIPVYSPVNGFVTRVNVNIGKYVNPSEVMFELVNPDDIHLNLKVFEKDLNRLKIGYRVTAFSNVDPMHKYPCEIILISKDILEDRTADVHCHFLSYDHALVPGMYMNAEVILSSGRSNTLSDDAIVSFEGKNYVFTENGKNTYRMCEVETGISREGFTEIKNTRDFEGKAIVLNGAYTLLMAMKNTEE